MKNIHLDELDNLVITYFGQDYDLIDDSEDIEPKIAIYLTSSSTNKKHELLRDIDVLAKMGANLDDAFHERYQYNFIPSLWNTTAQDFLAQVKENVIRALDNEHSPEG